VGFAKPKHNRTVHVVATLVGVNLAVFGAWKYFETHEIRVPSASGKKVYRFNTAWMTRNFTLSQEGIR